MLEGTTLVPVLLGIDETNVNVLGRMSCHPLYLSIGNLPKNVWCTYSQHAYILVGYFPSLDAIAMEGDRPAFTEGKRSLYQECLRSIIKDLDHVTKKYVHIEVLQMFKCVLNSGLSPYALSLTQ